MGKEWWTGSSEHCGTIDAGGCLFNVQTDPTEHIDLAKTLPAKLEELRARVKVLRQDTFNPDRCLPFKASPGSFGQVGAGCPDAQKLFEDMISFYGGYVGPWMPPWMQPV